MVRKIITTGDGSRSIYVPELDEHYHSVYGAVQESRHIFIGNGYDRLPMQARAVLEVGFGTGLNAFLTFDLAIRRQQQLYYESWEKYPLQKSEWLELGYPEYTGLEKDLFISLHTAPWQTESEICPGKVLKKIRGDIREFRSDQYFDLVYFDAFGPEVQEELWSGEVFKLIAGRQHPGSLLVTYSVKGMVTRNIKAAGYQVNKVPGPPGKREISVAKRIS